MIIQSWLDKAYSYSDQMVHSDLDLFLQLLPKVPPISFITHQFHHNLSSLWLTYLIRDKALVYKDLY